MYKLDDIKSIPIQDVCNILGIQLNKKSGANIFGKIRNEKTGSFSINPDKNIWRDWGMNEGGSVIDLVMKVEGYNQGQAIKYLADHFGIEGEANESDRLPTKAQYNQIGIISTRAMANFDINLENQRVEDLEKLERKYSVTMQELSKSNPTMYHNLVDKQALPRLYNNRNELEIMLEKMYKADSSIEYKLYEGIVLNLEKSLNDGVRIYNTARVDNKTLNELLLTRKEFINKTFSSRDIADFKCSIEKLEAHKLCDNTIENLKLIDDVISAKYEALTMFTEIQWKEFENPHAKPSKNKIYDNEGIEIPDVNLDTSKILDNQATVLDRINLKESVPQMNFNKPTYYLTQRPPSIGTHPNGSVSINTFDYKQPVENGVDNIEAYGYVQYEKFLTPTQIKDYELYPTIKLGEAEISYLNARIEQGMDVGVLTSDSYSVEQMGKIAYAIDNNLDYNSLLDTKLSAMDMEKLINSQETIENVKPSFVEGMDFNKDTDVDGILELLKNGVGNIFENENFVNYLDFQSKFYKYSSNNNLLIAMQNPEATNVASFNSWRALGRSVNKGEKGICILAPNVKKMGAKEILYLLNQRGNAKIGQWFFEKKGNNYSVSSKHYSKNNLSEKDLESFIKSNKIQAQYVASFRKVYVFDISQTTGEPVPDFKISLTDDKLVDENGYYKNPLVNIHLSEGEVFEKGDVMTFKQVFEEFSIKDMEVKELKLEAEAKGECYPYLKQSFSMILNPEKATIKDIHLNLGNKDNINLFKELSPQINYSNILPSLEKTLSSTSNDMEVIVGIRKEIENLCKTKGIEVSYNNDTSGANGYFSPKENKIVVNSELGISHQTKTLIHEYAHSQAHTNGYSGVEIKDNLEHRQVAEIEAEGTAYVVAKHFGFDTSSYSFDYVSTWAKGKEMGELKDTLNTIKKASEQIINDIKNPLELSVYNNRSNIEQMLIKANVKPSTEIINNIKDINKKTGKINTLSDFEKAEKYNTYPNKDVTDKIKSLNKKIEASVEIKTVEVKVLVR